MSKEQTENKQNPPTSLQSANNNPVEPMSRQSKARDKWDIIDIILKPVGGLITALVIGLLAYYTQGYLQSLDRIAERNADNVRKFRLYTELLNQREQSESKLRSEMFSKIIDSFITKNPNNDIDEQVLDLELLVHNFHESLNLTPLFAYLHRNLRAPDKHLTEQERENMEKRLRDLAKEVALRQLLALTSHGDTIEFQFSFKALKLEQETYNIVVRDVTTDTEGPMSLPQRIGEGILKFAEQKQHFSLYLEGVDVTRERLNVMMEINGEHGSSPLKFWVDYFDFPMIDNTRIKGGNRIAVVLNEFNAESSQINGKNKQLDGAGMITVIGFPEAYASLKDRAFLQDLLEQLVGKDSQP
jgi:hypothetical protein